MNSELSWECESGDCHLPGDYRAHGRILCWTHSLEYRDAEELTMPLSRVRRLLHAAERRAADSGPSSYGEKMNYDAANRIANAFNDSFSHLKKEVMPGGIICVGIGANYTIFVYTVDSSVHHMIPETYSGLSVVTKIIGNIEVNTTL